MSSPDPVSAGPEPGLPVPVALQRSAHRDRREWIDSGLFAVDLLSRTMGQADLAGVEVLDVGCGTKIVKTILDNEIAVGRYVGIDAYAPVIDFLKANVTDPRFEFGYFDARNDLYNPTGTPLGAFERLPVGPDPFDLICLFSVFTHLAPDDFVSMLRLTRGHVKPDGTLLFSLFLNDPEHPSRIAQQLQADVKSDDPVIAETARRVIAKALAAKDRGFLDEVPETPLLRALYDVDFAYELVDGTGWEIVSVHPPEDHIQHYMICRPA